VINIDPKALILFIVVAAFALILFGSFIDYVGYYNSASKTPNVTGLGAVMVSFITAIFALIIILKLFNYI